MAVRRLRFCCEPIRGPGCIFLPSPRLPLRHFTRMNPIVTLQALIDFTTGPGLFLFTLFATLELLRKL